jgi:hypothetical protein
MKRKNKRLILEFTEFNLQRMNPDQGGMMPNVTNPQLSINAFDRHEDAIRAATNKLNSLIHSMGNSSQLNVLKSKLALEDQKLESLKILRIIKVDGVRYDVYISFVIAEEEYWGSIKDILGEEPEFHSEVFKDADLILTKDWMIKIKGTIVKIIKKWFIPENGTYRNLNEDTHCYNVTTGNIQKIAKDTEIEVVRAYDNKIVIKHEDDYYNLVGDSFIYFNYWFNKVI